MQLRIAENVPKTQDNMREFDPSMLTANPIASTSSATDDDLTATVAHDLIALDTANDPFEHYFTSQTDPSIPPKVLITTGPAASRTTYDFCDELVGIFPGAEFVRRKKGKGFEMGRIAGWAAGRGYGSMMVVNENMKKPSECLTVPAKLALYQHSL